MELWVQKSILKFVNTLNFMKRELPTFNYTRNRRLHIHTKRSVSLENFGEVLFISTYFKEYLLKMDYN